MLVEADYAHRDLPTGSDVEHGDSVFWVEVECVRPDLEARAIELLSRS